MRRIREARNLTVADLHEETKIPQGLIEAFEDKALFDHPQFNRVYLRSFVRTYAQVVEIDADVALEGLEEALSGRYVGSLAVAYLGEEPEDLPDETVAADEQESPDERHDEEEEDRAGEDNIDRKTERAPKAGTTKKERARGKRENEDTGEQDEDEEARASFVSTTQATAAGFQKSKAERELAEDDVEEWTAQSPPPGTTERTPSRRPRRDGPDRRWVLGGALVVAVAALVWILVSVMDGSEEQASLPAVREDTAAAVETPETAAPASPTRPVDIPSLGDTMTVRIVAAHGKVDPIRVTVDEDLRRPYWIERGDSMMFRPTSQIVIEELLDSVDVKLEGLEYPTSRRDEQGRIVITRDAAQNYFASLRQSE